MLTALLLVPQGFNLERWIVAEMARLPERQGLKKDQLLQQLKSADALSPLQNVFNLSDWQRLGWFLFFEAGALSNSVLASIFATLALIDYAYGQAQRIRAVISYVLLKSGEFPPQMVGLLSQTERQLQSIPAFRAPYKASKELKPFVRSHSKVQPDGREKIVGRPFWQTLSEKLLREPAPRGSADVLGFRFSFSSSIVWKFREFSVPLRASVPALGLLVYLALRWKGERELSQWLPDGQTGEFLVWGEFAALGFLTALALQGAVVIHARLKTLAGLFSLLAILVFVSVISGGALTLVSVLAGVGLLDNGCDFSKLGNTPKFWLDISGGLLRGKSYHVCI